jgi:hypothetical protein
MPPVRARPGRGTSSARGSRHARRGRGAPPRLFPAGRPVAGRAPVDRHPGEGRGRGWLPSLPGSRPGKGRG